LRKTVHGPTRKGPALFVCGHTRGARSITGSARYVPSESGERA
jgi:hypothetical protein